MATMQKDQILRYRGEDLVDSDGSKIGKIEEIYLDAESNEPEWALVHTGLFGTKRTFVPLHDATEADGQLRVPFDKGTVKDAPGIEANGQLSQREEAELYRHYGRDYGTHDVGETTGRSRDTVGHDTSGPTTDDAMTRSEEELRVGTREREAGRVRLRKRVETEPVSETVTTRRETARVEREPITDANVGRAMDGPDISEEEHEMQLTAEEAVVAKQTVPKERVRLEKDVVTEEETVTDELRKERIEAEGDLDDAGGRWRR